MVLKGGNGSNGGSGGNGGNDDDDPYWEKAEELAQMGLPPKICWHALKMFGLSREGVQRATSFLWSADGQGYIERMQQSVQKKKGPDLAKQNALVKQLMEMGMEEAVSNIAAKECNSIDSALEWIFSHPNAVEEEALRQSSLKSKEKQKKKKTTDDDAATPEGNGGNTNTDILVETATKFDGLREGCVFRLGSDGLGYYKDVPNKSFKTAKPVVAKAAPAATIDVATLNRSIGMYGSGMSNFSTNSLFEKKKSLFSL